MKIAVDAFPLTGHITGIGRYVLEICSMLDRLIPEAEFLLYSPKPLAVELPSERWRSRIGGDWTVSSYIWLKTVVTPMAEADGAQAFWATRTILPSRSPRFRTVATVHDLNYKVLPTSMPYLTLLAHRFWFERDLHRANAVVTNSQGTAARLLDVLGVRADGVARPGVASSFRRQPTAVVREFLKSLGVESPYFLAVGTVEPRKNFPALIEAYLSLKREGEISEYRLLIAGSRGWRDRRLRSSIAEAESQGVRWLGFVRDDELAALYAGAAAFVFPSLYEGFGIPVAEASACGTRVVATDLPELREAAGASGIYVEPTVEGIRSGMMAAVNTRTGNVATVSDTLSGWDNAAQVMVDQFKRLIDC